MEAASDPPSGTYVYAVVQGDRGVVYGAIGLDAAEVYRVTHEEISAVVSQIARSRVRPERRHLAAHNAVLRRALDEQAVLPMAFGLIASDSAAVLGLLRKNASAIRTQLAAVTGKIEMGLRVLWDVPNVFEYFVNRRSELREARDAVGDVRQARHGDLLSLGQLFERTLIEERERHVERVSAVLSRSGLLVKLSAPRSEREVMNLACLVPQALQGDFERIVGEAATEFDNHFTFDISGPWAPHNFVELDLRT